MQVKAFKLSANRLLFFGIACGVVFSIVALWWHKRYPFGYRNCCLPCMMHLLSQYADDHANWYPRSGNTAVDCLRELYPKYTLAEVSILAGISGNIKETRDSVKGGRPLTGDISSWVYFPGFRSDDGHVAVIWESKPGITMNGHSCDGHAVGFADGAYEQIASKDWDSFVAEQKRLMSEVLAKHK